MQILLGLKKKLRVSRALALLGCIVFTASIFYPFLQTAWFVPWWAWKARVHYVDYWSFQEAATPRDPYTYFAFADYWIYEQALGAGPPFSLSFGRITYYMFATQLLTIAASFLAIIKQKRCAIVLPTLFAATTLVLMILAQNASSDLAGQKTFQSGFWLTAVSLTLFSTAMISLVLRKGFTDLW